MHGHRDDHIDWNEGEDETGNNHGNFIELVRFRAETDITLANHFANSPRNARYTSKTIQNELINIIGNTIRNDILAEVKKAKFYTIIADEVTDTANKEQLSIVLQYVLDCEVKEIFADFVEVERITGKELAASILNSLSTWGLPHSDMRGQCYDGASGARSGCKALIQREAPLAVSYHCPAHRLNLAVMSACKIQSMKNAESYVGEISRFFSYSAKKQRLFEKAMECSTKAKKLKDACRTRWIQRIYSYVVFLELLPALHMCLTSITYPSRARK